MFDMYIMFRMNSQFLTGSEGCINIYILLFTRWLIVWSVFAGVGSGSFLVDYIFCRKNEPKKYAFCFSTIEHMFSNTTVMLISGRLKTTESIVNDVINVEMNSE